MAGGVWSGFATGLLVSAVAASAVSVAVGLPETLRAPVPLANPPKTEAADVTAPAEVSEPVAVRPAADAPAPETVQAPEVAQPTTPAVATLSPETRQSAAIPQVSQSVDAPSDAAVVVAGAPVINADTPVLTAPKSVGPILPSGDAAPRALAAPAPLPRPEATLPLTEPDTRPSEDGTTRVAAADPGVPVQTDAPTQQPAPLPVVRRPAETEAEADGPTVGARAVSLVDRGGAVPVRRPETQGETNADPGDPLPLDRFSVPVDLPPDTARMAIVLIHDGTGPVVPEALRRFPVPVTVAVDASLPDAADLARAYRAEGLEVLVLLDIPSETDGYDAALAVQRRMAQMPEVVGVLEGTGAGLQGSRAISEQVTDLLLAEGYGLVLQDSGLNAALQRARREGLPAASVARDFDGGGQDGRAMRRFLDQAAFRARQDGTTVVMGRMRPDTLSSLLLWGLQDRADGFALVPVSAVLPRSGPDGAELSQR